MHSTPKGSRLHIALFGRRNAGKSSLINAITQQDIALVSDVAGTTTDPVYKAMEILPIGPVMLIDTAGIDDIGQLGEMRVEKSLAVLEKTDVVLLVLDSTKGISEYEKHILNLCEKRKLPVITIFHKTDLLSQEQLHSRITTYKEKFSYPEIAVSSLEGTGIDELKQQLITSSPNDFLPVPIVGDLISEEDTLVLVVPIDSAAPKGRLILPQVQTLRDILDHDGHTMVCKETNLAQTLSKLKEPPNLVITDSQAFHEVAQILPPDVPLTSFSILMARYKGDLEILAQGASAIDQLKPGDKLLIAEACSHHKQEDDIGTVKIPRLLQKKIGGELHFDFVNGTKFPDDLTPYKLVIHCGGCMLNRKEMLYRLRALNEQNVPVSNYGIVLAHLNGILPRAIAPLKLYKDKYYN